MKDKELIVPSLKRMLSMLGEQAESLRPEKKPNRETIGAARASATVVNSYISGVRLALDADKSRGEKPNMEFLRLGDKTTESIAA